MGDIADSMVNGEVCCGCGGFIGSREVVYIEATREKLVMPTDGSPAGMPVLCQNCV